MTESDLYKELGILTKADKGTHTAITGGVELDQLNLTDIEQPFMISGQTKAFIPRRIK